MKTLAYINIIITIILCIYTYILHSDIKKLEKKLGMEISSVEHSIDNIESMTTEQQDINEEQESRIDEIDIENDFNY